MKFLAKFFQTDGGHIKERIYDPYKNKTFFNVAGSLQNGDDFSWNNL